jgi:hypothetical protein
MRIRGSYARRGARRVIGTIFAVLVLGFGGCTGTGTDSTETATASSSAAAYTFITLNEVQSAVTTGYIVSDFVELYNSSDESFTFAAGEWYITDSDGAPTHVFYIPSGTVIAAKGYLVLLPDGVDSSDTTATLPSSYLANADGTNTDGYTNAAFGLGKSDSVSLYYTGSLNTTPTTAVDSTTWTAKVATRSRKPDGGDWSSSDACTPTPGATNGSE